MRNQKGFRMTPTNEAIIRRIASRRFVSFSELRRDILKDHGRQRSWAILKRLVRFKYLAECRGDWSKLLGWRINWRSQRVRKIIPEEERSSSRAPVYRTANDHDAVLRDVCDVFLESGAARNWVYEYELRIEICRHFAHLRGDSKREKMGSIPDAKIDVQIRGTDFQAAVELELTQKSRFRLYQKMERYVINPGFRVTFYIVKRCRLELVRAPKTEELILKSLKKLAENPEQIDRWLEIYAKGSQSELPGLEGRLKAFDAELKTQAKRQENLMARLADLPAEIPADLIYGQLKTVQEKSKELEITKTELARQRTSLSTKTVDRDRLLFKIRRTISNLEKAPVADQRPIFSNIIQFAELYPTKVRLGVYAPVKNRGFESDTGPNLLGSAGSTSVLSGA